MNKRTKIVCTLGPSSNTVQIIQKMVNAGMNVARLNFSHGTHSEHLQFVKRIREVEKKTGHPVAILQDLQGPKIRVGELPKDGLRLQEGEDVVFDTAKKEFKSGIIPVDYSDLHKYVKKGHRMLIDDGRIEAHVLSISGTSIKATVVVGGNIISHKGINVPDTSIATGALTEKDKTDAKFAVEHALDFIALSFVTSAKDILDLRYLIKEYEKELKIKSQHPIQIVAKIERGEAVKKIDEIIDTVDGIMVARGDLGIEVHAEDVPLIQKEIIQKCLRAAKPVIVATQMLDSMKQNPRPTRAEVSDVANAVIDHADAVMLSGESATGKYPVRAVKMMSTIISQTEKSAYDDLYLHFEKNKKKKKRETDDLISELSRLMAEEIGAKLILAASITGETGRLISRYRPELVIAVATSEPRVLHQLNLSWGVVPFPLLPCKSIEELIERSILETKKKNITKKGDKIIVVAGEPVGQAGNMNLLEVKEVN